MLRRGGESLWGLGRAMCDFQADGAGAEEGSL
jgi:hypothetical protein